MKLLRNGMELMKPQLTPRLTIVLFATLTLVLLTVFPLCYRSLGGGRHHFNNFFQLQDYFSSSSPSSQPPPPPPPPPAEEDNSLGCDLYEGEWVPNPDAPYYTNRSCWAIHEHQNCIKYGRPDDGFMKWRWKPDGCDLPIFNPAQFLEIVRGKSLAFVGDSVGRNQMQSLICLLSRVAYPIDVSTTRDENLKRWSYPSHNFTMATFWAPHLVRAEEEDPNGPTHTGLFNLYLDEFNTDWTAQIHHFDYVIINAGHWFYRPALYYENRHLTGCRFCQLDNVTDLPMYYGYRRAFRTAFRAINSSPEYKGVTILRTFSPSHFENGEWNQGGNCVRTTPFGRGEARLDGVNLEMYMAQMEEFRDAEREGEKRGLKFRVLDTTQAMLLRPDGHPGTYGHVAGANVTLYNDCVHWCLPGPIDAWSDFLLQMLKMEGVRSSYREEEEKKLIMHSSDRKMRFR